MVEKQRKSPFRRTWSTGSLFVGLGGVSLLIIGAIVVILLPGSERAQTRRALDLARLADLPNSASSVKADGTSNILSRTSLLRFQASADEIEVFISSSSGLRGVSPEYFTPDHMSLPYPQGGEASLQHHYFSFDARYPWFDPTIRN